MGQWFHTHRNWIHNPMPGIAYQCIEGGYIPYSPHGGRHVCDDFGNLVLSIPSWFGGMGNPSPYQVEI